MRRRRAVEWVPDVLIAGTLLAALLIRGVTPANVVFVVMFGALMALLRSHQRRGRER